MPTYEYECSKCGSRFEKFQKMTDKPRSPCPKCGGKAERLISSGAGVIFKGSGFYATDYKKEPRSTKDSKPAQCPKADKCQGCSLDK